MPLLGTGAPRQAGPAPPLASACQNSFPVWAFGGSLVGKKMNERHQDCELLRAFVRQGDQPAFAAVVRRHLDLVYATALRKLENPGAAEEVAQNVFAALARKAWQFAPDDSLPAWLYRTTLLESKTWLRGDADAETQWNEVIDRRSREMAEGRVEARPEAEMTGNIRARLLAHHPTS